MRRTSYPAIAVAVLLVLFLVLPFLALSEEVHYLAELEASPKIQSLLKHLVSSLATDFEGSLERIPPTLLADVDEQTQRIRVIVEADKPKEVADAIEAWGGRVEDLYKETIQAVIPLSAVTEVANLREVHSVRLPFHPILYGNPIVSEGVSIIGAEPWHQAGWDGQGVKVAILDSFKGYKRLLGEELPDEVVVRTFPEDLDIEGGPDEPEEEAVHGTGIAEIIHDIAPQATLYLVRSSNRRLEEAVEWLIGQGVDVINTSWGLNTGCYGGDGLLDPIVERARDEGILWVASAGNHAREHWEGDWRDGDRDGQMDFGREESLSLEAREDQEVRIFLSWDDPCGESNNDYNLYLYNDNLTDLISESTEIQNGNDLSLEIIDVKAPYTGTYRVVIEKKPSARDRQIELFVDGARLEDPVPESSLIEPATSQYTLTVGATDPTDNTIRRYSSRGPTNDGRIKPDLAAPDCVSTATYGCPADPSRCIFFGFPGTSASAPHVAGAAALVKQAHPDWGPAQIQEFLVGRAEDMGLPGKDNKYGAGLLMLGSPPSPAAQVPAAPTDLSAKAISPTQVSLSWQDNSEDEEDFKIERKKEGGDWSQIAAVDANTTEYLDNGLQPGTEYCYRVRAYNAQGNSDYSNEACATTPLKKQPPVAKFSYHPSQPKPGEPVTLDASGSSDSDGTIVQYEWDFDDGSSGYGMIVTHAFARPGSYRVTLTVTDNDGLTGSVTQEVVVVAEEEGYQALAPGVPERGAVEAGQLKQYTIKVLDGTKELQVRLRTQFNGALNLYVRYGRPIEVVNSRVQTDFFSPSSWGQSSIAIAEPKAGIYYIAVENPGNVSQEFTLLAATVPMLESITPGAAIEGTIAEAAPGESWLGLTQYLLEVPEDSGRLKVTLENLGLGRLGLHIRYGEPVEVINGRVIADYSSTGLGMESLSLTLLGPRLKPGKYYIAVENLEPYPQRFRLKVSLIQRQEVR